MTNIERLLNRINYLAGNWLWEGNDNEWLKNAALTTVIKNTRFFVNLEIPDDSTDYTLVEIMGRIYRLLYDADRTIKTSPNYDHSFMETCYREQAKLIAHSLKSLKEESAIQKAAPAKLQKKTFPKTPGPKQGARKATIRRRAAIKILGKEGLTDLQACTQLKDQKIPLPSKRLQTIYKYDWPSWFRNDSNAFHKQWSRDINSN